MRVQIVGGEGVRRFGNKDLFAEILLDIRNQGRQVFQRAVPVAVVAVGHHVKIHGIVALTDFADVFFCVALADVGEVDGHQRLRQHPTDGGTACVHQGVAAFERPVTGHTAVDFVAHLHHHNVDARVADLRQCVRGEGGECSAFFLQRHFNPRLGTHLLGRVCPEVAVVEVHQQRKSGGLAAPRDFHRAGHIAVAAAVAHAAFVKRIVPDADADDIPSCIFQQHKQIRLHAVFIKVAHATFFLRQHGGHVRTEPEILRKPGNRGDRGFFPQRTGQQKTEKQKK